MSRILSTALIAITLSLGFVGAAWSHAVLLGSTPAAEASLDVSPKEIIFNFNENVGPIFIKVLDRTGKEVGNPGEWRVDGNDVLMSLNGELPNGTYIATYRVISADTHPVGGSVVFAVGEEVASMGDVAAAGGETSGWVIPVAINRYIQYGAMLLAAGAALFIVGMSVPGAVEPSVYKMGRTSAAVAAVTYVLALGFGGAEMMLGGPTAIFSMDAWSQSMASTLAPSALIGIPGLLVLYIAFGKGPEGKSSPLLIAGAAIAVASFLVTGHAATAAPVWLMAPMVAVHLFCAAFWIAALYPLAKTAQVAEVTEAGAVMTQFSERAVWTVGALFLSGAVITWTQVEGLQNMLTTDYGLRLTAKIAIFVMLLGLAAMNKMVLTPALEKGDAAASGKLRRSIKFEYAAMVLIIGAAVSLTLATPPRATMDMEGGGGMAMGGGFTTSVIKGKYTAEVSVDPAGTTASNMVMVSFKDDAGNPVEMVDVTISWALPTAGLEGIDGRGEMVTPGMYHFMFDQLIIPGEWDARIDAFVDDFDKQIFRTTVPIK
ncbi:MAG: CopD family protein [Rhodospirillaceae bacterium]|nr:CopD family protein [Rhodospirillaceae bacterium]